MAYVVGVDVGGTFTDCVVIDHEGHISMDKAFTTPHDLSEGILASLNNVCRSLETTADSVLSDTRIFAFGTTSLTNRVVARTGARVGLIATRGHEDALFIGRLLSRTEGLRETERYDISAWNKPKPVVSREAIRGVSERIDSKGDVIVPVDRNEVRIATRELQELGVESIAVAFLWSFLNPSHEQIVRSIVNDLAPGLLVSLSSEVAPTLGEYERTNTTILNAFLAPGARQDLRTMEARLKERGLRGRILLMESHGGLTLTEEVERMPIRALAAGPVGGVMGAAKLATMAGYESVICTDMGGTSFDVGLVIDGQPRFTNETVIDRHRIRTPTVEISSIGAGGGSIAFADALTGELRVGPQSAGSVPGPVCYGRGGTSPTVTDADVVLGRIDPGSFFGNRLVLDKQAALDALGKKIAEPLGIDVIEAARSIVDIVDARMADLIRALTVERGHDPRNFVLFAYGGAGPTHVGAYASQIGVRSVIIPLYASVQSAFGIATADLRRHYSQAQPMREPFDQKRIDSTFEELGFKIRSDWIRAGIDPEDASYRRSVDMRFRHQVHEIRVGMGRDDDPAGAIRRFVELYEQAFGSGTAIRNAETEIVTFHLVSSAPAARIVFPRARIDRRKRRAASITTRSVYFDGRFHQTEVFDVRSLSHGRSVVGPAVIEASNTTIVVHPKQRAGIDEYRNVVVTV